MQAQGAHLELYLRDLHAKGYAPATISRRLSTVAGLFRYAVIDEVVAKNPTLAVSRPKVQWEGQRRTSLHPLEFAAMLTTARQHSDTAHALLGMLGLRVSEACQAQVSDRNAAHSVAAYLAGGYGLSRSSEPALRCNREACVNAIGRREDGPTRGRAVAA